jgi:uncharacterized protein
VSEIRVTVVHALPEAATEIALTLPAGATVADAIEGSQICAQPGLSAVSHGAVGIFGKRVRLDTVLSDGDRVELYRPLKARWKPVRRRPAAKK